MAEPDLRFIGERLERVQAELRELRGVKQDVVALRAEMMARFAAVDARFQDLEQAMDARLRDLESRFQNLEQTMESRFQNLERAMDARFAQAHETMATNFAVLLEAIRDRKPR